MRIDIDVALAALDECGGGSGIGVAQYLHDLQIRGPRNSACDCPVAKFLRRRTFGGAISVTPVAVRNIYFYTHSDPVYYYHPAGVAEFIEMHDDGLFPDLVSES